MIYYLIDDTGCLSVHACHVEWLGVVELVVVVVGIYLVELFIAFHSTQVVLHVVAAVAKQRQGCATLK